MKINNETNQEKELKIEHLAINIDMVKGFVVKGALAAPSIMRVVRRQHDLLEPYKEDDNKAIAIIRDLHHKGSVEYKTFGEHCQDDTEEPMLVDELQDFKDTSYDFTKNSTNFVFAPGFMDFVARLKNLKTVLLMGCLSEVCVKNGGITLRNLFDQLDRDIDIYVAEDGIDTYDVPGHNAEEVTQRAIEEMNANGIKVLAKGKRGI